MGVQHQVWRAVQDGRQLLQRGVRREGAPQQTVPCRGILYFGVMFQTCTEAGCDAELGCLSRHLIQTLKLCMEDFGYVCMSLIHCHGKEVGAPVQTHLICAMAIGSFRP